MTNKPLTPTRISRHRAIVANVIRRDDHMHPFGNVRIATIEALELAMRATDNHHKRRAWRRVHKSITGKDYWG